MADPDGNKPFDVIYRNTAGIEIARQKNKDNFDQYITVLQGTVTIDENGGQSGSADLKTRLDKVVYHNRHPQINTPPPPTVKKPPVQAPVNNKQTPVPNSSVKTEQEKSTIDKVNDVVSTGGIVVASLQPTFQDGAARVTRSGGNPRLWLKKNIFASPHLVNNNAVNLGKAPGGFVKATNTVLTKAAPVLTVISEGLTLYNIGKDGKVTTGEVFTGVNTALQIAFPVYGFFYGMVDLGFTFFTDKSLTDRIQGAIDDKVGAEIQFYGTKK